METRGWEWKPPPEGEGSFFSEKSGKKAEELPERVSRACPPPAQAGGPSAAGSPHCCFILKGNRQPSVGFQQEGKVETGRHPPTPPQFAQQPEFMRTFGVGLTPVGPGVGWAADASSDGRPPPDTARFPRCSGRARTSAISPKGRLSPAPTPCPGPPRIPCRPAAQAHRTHEQSLDRRRVLPSPAWPDAVLQPTVWSGETHSASSRVSTGKASGPPSPTVLPCSRRS